MVKVLFVCLGNICRSPMAEFVFKDMVRKKGLEDKFVIDSAATSDEEVGNGMHYGTVRKLEEMGISYSNHRARQIELDDYRNFDFVIGMEDRNVWNIVRILGDDRDKKVYRLLDFSKRPRDIADPWYTGNFDRTYEDIVEGCEGLLEVLIRKLDV